MSHIHFSFPANVTQNDVTLFVFKIKYFLLVLPSYLLVDIEKRRSSLMKKMY